jgi:cellulose synthase/poly-beta-1,6-N-acetylglucosamine synthase-like glycosyltransferase
MTIVAWGAVSWETGHLLLDRYASGDVRSAVEEAVFIIVTQLLIYGGLVYQFTRYGYLYRLRAHVPVPEEARENLYEQPEAPGLTILVPSYKEEASVVRRSLVSAALQDYPNRRVVLLIDDPPRPVNHEDRAALRAMRQIPPELGAFFDVAAEPFVRAERAFNARGAEWCPLAEAQTLAALYRDAAKRVASLRARWDVNDHADRLFVKAVLNRLIRAHRHRARELIRIANAEELTRVRAAREYRRLVALFRVDIVSFERKAYTNLSHAANKAMNLNAYLALIGGAWREVRHNDNIYLVRATPDPASFRVPEAVFVITLDADSVLVPEYALVLVQQMLADDKASVAVAQTPYSAFPGAPGRLERTAGATTDIQYRIHQGFTRYGASYWVGANALLRMAALRDIRTSVEERGFEIPVFIKDRTVIEDTESTIDLVLRGWSLYNYPERLAFSATPPDFGSLVIQRARWANGGLLIFPKLLRHLATPPLHWAKIVEGFFRTHYLVSIAGVNVGLLILLGHNFEKSIETAWLPLSAMPYFLLYARDLQASGYRSGDVVRIYALNLLLLPVNLSGVANSLIQGLTGWRVPFGRTPKVRGRIMVPLRYILMEYGLLAWWLVAAIITAIENRWMSASFCLANALVLAYAIAVFVGFRASWQDFAAGWGARKTKARRAQLSARQFSEGLGTIRQRTVS